MDKVNTGMKEEAEVEEVGEDEEMHACANTVTTPQEDSLQLSENEGMDEVGMEIETQEGGEGEGGERGECVGDASLELLMAGEGMTQAEFFKSQHALKLII